MGFEPTASSLGSWHSTTELLPHLVRLPTRPRNSILLPYCVPEKQPSTLKLQKKSSAFCVRTNCLSLSA
jgi:hypothetical protein